MRVPPRDVLPIPLAPRCAHLAHDSDGGLALGLGHTVLDQVVHVLIVEQPNEVEGAKTGGATQGQVPNHHGAGGGSREGAVRPAWLLGATNPPPTSAPNLASPATSTQPEMASLGCAPVRAEGPHPSHSQKDVHLHKRSPEAPEVGPGSRTFSGSCPTCAHL